MGAVMVWTLVWKVNGKTHTSRQMQTTSQSPVYLTGSVSADRTISRVWTQSAETELDRFLNVEKKQNKDDYQCVWCLWYREPLNQHYWFIVTAPVKQLEHQAAQPLYSHRMTWDFLCDVTKHPAKGLGHFLCVKPQVSSTPLDKGCCDVSQKHNIH